MLTSVRSLLAATALAGAFAATPALAQEEESTPSVTVTGSASVTSDYRFRGVSLSGGDPAIQAGITVSHESGFYVGTWGSSIDDGGTDIYGEMELDLFAGWSGEVADGVKVDAGILLYAYPTNEFGPVDYWEPYASVAGTFGPVTAKLGMAYAWEQDGLGGNDNFYVYTNFDTAIPGAPVTLSAHLGYTDGVLAPPLLAGTGDDNGLDWSIGATASIYSGLSAGVSYVGDEGPSIDGFTDDAIVATLSFTG